MGDEIVLNKGGILAIGYKIMGISGWCSKN